MSFDDESILVLYGSGSGSQLHFFLVPVLVPVMKILKSGFLPVLDSDFF